MDEDDECDALRQVLEGRCPRAKFKGEDIKKLVDAGYDTEFALAAATKNPLDKVLPTRPGVVDVLVQAFIQPTEGCSHSKRLRIEDPKIQSFAESAANHYTQWEQAEKPGVEKGVHKKFLVVSADPFGNYPAGLLVWIRKCYQDLKDILKKAKKSERFVLLGTAGIGKSMFTLFWLCYRATLKEKVVWKFADDKCYLLDFSKEGSLSATRFSENDSELRVVFDDPNAWLIIDGKQSGNLNYECHILLACSAKRENYKEFSKNGMVSKRYVPVWSEEEIIEFLDDFEVHRANYSHMDVPTKDKANEAFEKLGGVPRYVLRVGKFKEGFTQAECAVDFLSRKTCLKLFSGTFEEEAMSDCLVHIKCRDTTYEIESMFYDFASSYVQDKFGKRFTELSKVDVVEFLRSYANKDIGSAYGYIFELVAHHLMRRGGEFPMKRVGVNGLKIPDDLQEESTLTLQGGMKLVEFAEVEELASMSLNTYYKPLSSNFESVDALVYPNILLQFFSSRRGKHGYKVNGLKTLHEHLKQTKYKLCSCVPVEKYKNTGFQNSLKAVKNKYPKVDTPLDRMDQYVVQVDYNNY